MTWPSGSTSRPGTAAWSARSVRGSSAFRSPKRPPRRPASTWARSTSRSRSARGFGDIAPDFAVVTFAGETVKLSRLAGRYVLLDFWATWCGPCVTNLPPIGKIHDTFGKDRRLTVLGVSIDDDPIKTRQFVEREKLTWTQAFLGGGAKDKADLLSRYGVISVPTYVLIGPDGKLIHRGWGGFGEINQVLTA